MSAASTEDTEVLNATVEERHFLNRMTPGFSQDALRQLRSAGTPLAWLEQQLHTESVVESPVADHVDSWFPRVFESPEVKFDERKAERSGATEYGFDFGNWAMMRQIYSARGLHEMMVEFWSHHFNVGARDSSAWMCRKDLDTILRTHALGNFGDLLEAVTLSNAMQAYLDNFRSTRGSPNENHGRELLELHTVTRSAGYTEAQVKSSAVILSGWTMDWSKTFTVRYKPSLHTLGAVRVLGFTSDNEQEDGSQLSKDYLRFLARHRSTAQNICRKLATFFVSDVAPQSLVDALAVVFQQKRGDIKAVLRTLVRRPEFLSAVDQKVRTPTQDLVATIRSLDVQPGTPTEARSLARQLNTMHGGDWMYFWPAPDGAPITDPAWCSTSRVIRSMRMHWNLLAQTHPVVDTVYHAPAYWLPGAVALHEWVDHLAQAWLGRSADTRLVDAAVQSTGLPADTVISADHELMNLFEFARLGAVILDSPNLMRR